MFWEIIALVVIFGLAFGPYDEWSGSSHLNVPFAQVTKSAISGDSGEIWNGCGYAISKSLKLNKGVTKSEFTWVVLSDGLRPA